MTPTKILVLRVNVGSLLKAVLIGKDLYYVLLTLPYFTAPRAHFLGVDNIHTTRLLDFELA